MGTQRTNVALHRVSGVIVGLVFFSNFGQIEDVATASCKIEIDTGDYEIKLS